MLVLGITGALIAGVFIGIGTSLNAQRYRDAVTSFKSLLQTQYSELQNVRNDRTNDVSCDASAATSASSPEVRGQSECVMVGRLVSIVGDSVSIYAVLAREIAAPTDIANDIDDLRENYFLNVSPMNQEDSLMEWGTSISWPSEVSGGADPRELSVFMFRSPESGQVYTVLGDDANDSPSDALLKSMLVSGDAVPGQGGSVVCVDPSGLTPGDRMAIVINSFASGPSAIESASNATLIDLGETAQC